MIVDYPNPVLSPERDDYNDKCYFNVSFKEENITIDDNHILIPATCTLNSSSLLALIKQGKASIVVSINSPSAFFRRVFVFEKSKLEKTIPIPKFHVKKNVEFCGYILANEEIKSFYAGDEFNELYFKNVKFDLKKGDVLAKGISMTIPIDDSELEKPISSIFSIRKNTDPEIEIEACFDDPDEKIVIYLSERLNQLYYEMKDFNNGALHRYLNGIVVYPVLIEALSYVCDFYRGCGAEDYSEKRWFNAIVHKLNRSDINIETDYDNYSYAQLADKLLGGITYDGLASVKTTIDSETNGGEYINTGAID